MTDISPAASPPAALVDGRDVALLAEAKRMIETTTWSQTRIAVQLKMSQTTPSSWKRRNGWVRPNGAPRAPSFEVVKDVRATRSKWLRAEPVSALYAQGRVHHAGTFPALEDEMCDFGTDGLSAGRSPDRVDALVWALTALMLGPDGQPRVRGV